MKNKLQKHFPMIRTKGEALEAIKNNKKLWGIFLQLERRIPAGIPGCLHWGQGTETSV